MANGKVPLPIERSEKAGESGVDVVGVSAPAAGTYLNFKQKVTERTETHENMQIRIAGVCYRALCWGRVRVEAQLENGRCMDALCIVQPDSRFCI